MNPKSTGVRPIVGVIVPVWPTSRSAAAPASTPLSANATAITRFASTPRGRAVRKSSAAARICMPVGVRREEERERGEQHRVTTIVISVSQLGRRRRRS